jgi:Mg2+-importing ATPase
LFLKPIPPDIKAFLTAWFVESLLSQTLIVHMIHIRKIPFIQSWATAPVAALTSAIMLVAIAIPFSLLAASFKKVALPISFFPFLLVILVTYCVLTQLVKIWFIKKLNEWL